LDYPFLNFSGYTFYSICYTAGYFYPQSDGNYGLGKVQIQDLVFAYHAAILAVLNGVQCIIYKRGENKLSHFAIYYTVLAWSSVFFIFLLEQVLHWIQPTQTFNMIVYFGYLKLTVTLLKYIPLVYWNYKRQSTEGFSVKAILCDFTGGTFSIGQNLIDLLDGTTPIINPIKFGLGIVTMGYDSYLMLQHYVFYKESELPGKISLLSARRKNSSYGSFDGIFETSGRQKTPPKHSVLPEFP